MARKPTDDTEAFGSDSFLDVVCNVVGMLIILVVIVGIRAGRAGVSRAPDLSAETEAVGQLARQEAALEEETLRLAGQMQEVALQAQFAARERNGVAVLVAAAENELADKRRELDAQSRVAFDARRQVSEAASRAAALERELAAPAPKSPTVKLTSYQTPLSKTVNGKELQFQLRGGRVTMIPIDELLERFKSDAKAKVHRLRAQSEMTDTIGPIEGFRMEYTLERVDTPVEMQVRAGQAAAYVQLAEYVLIPESDSLGETLAEALAGRSQFRADLTPYRPSTTTVTLWTYDDSFPEFRALKGELHKLGFSVAGRPLPIGQPIGGSPHGSRSAAQ